MDCAQCGEANRDGARYCAGCGVPLGLRCANCRAELRPTAKFCDECGTPVGNAPTAPTEPTATRKIVTALFADLVGSTSFGERADAEVARSVMARYHALLQEAIDAHGGTVAKFMGDGMMATFGIPEIAEDDAIRAVRAGVDIQHRFTDFASDVTARHGETLGLRVGVNTGEVVIAHGDADLVGDALNVAARIEHACRPGRVTVGEETWRLTRGEFAYETLGEVTVAGRAQPVAIFEVTTDVTTRAETASPFVGRAPEMDRLRAVLDAAISARAARLVTVLGSPGVGKTRLSRELCAATVAERDAIAVELRCDRAGDATFAPIAQLIRDATELGDDPDPAVARARLATLLADDEPDRERLVDVFAGLVGVAPSRSVEETFWGVRRLVSASARDRPMVVVIDDIQWAEPLFLDLLEHLSEWVQGVPLLLLCLARPELREIRPSLAERGRRVEDVLALDGLDSAATEALAAGLLGTDRLPAGLVERLPTSTDGNPLFVRELVRMLVDDKVIRRNGDRWELAIDADAVEVPPTIQSLLAARVERLPHDERTVLELASVIGAEFNLGALRELAGTRTPLPLLLESMRRKELVEPTGTYWGDEPVHRFHHVLIRDAAYRRLLKTARADLHEQVAVWTDAAATGLIGEHEAVIAFHYEQAYGYRAELGTVDEHVVGLGRRAAELLTTAADRALGQDDLAAAGALARRALALLPATDAAARAELLTTACECTLASGDVAGARAVVEQLRAEAGDDPTLGAWASCFEAQLVGLTDPEGLVGAEATATGAAKVMEELGDGAGEAKAHQVRAGLLARLGRVGQAELELDLALGAARRVDDRRRVTAVLGAAPLAALWGPSPVARAGGRCLDVVRLLRITTASPSVEATSMRCQAVLEALRGRFDVARSMLDASRATLEELGLRHGLLETAYLTGVVELVAGDPAAAIGPLRDAYDGLIEMGVGIDAGRAAALLAHALVAEGRVDDAEPMSAASEELAGQDLKTAIAWRVARAEVLAARGDVAGGVPLAEEAVEIAAATDLVIDHADACAALAALHELAGDPRTGASVRAEAKRLYDLKGATVPAARMSDTATRAERAPTSSSPTPSPVPPTAVPAPVGPADPAERTALAENHATTGLFALADDGRISRQEMFAEEGFADALARLDEVGAGEPTDPRHPRAENAATRVARTYCDAWAPDRVDELLARFTALDVVRVDHRAVVGAPDAVGHEAFAESVRSLAAVGYTTTSFEPIAVRGERQCLGTHTYRDDEGFATSYLALVEIDADDRIIFVGNYDETDLTRAIDELDARFIAGEGASHARQLHVTRAVWIAVRDNDTHTLGDLLAPGFVTVDHQRIGFGTGDRASFLDQRATDQEVVTRGAEFVRTGFVAGDAVVAVYESQRTDRHGGEFEWSSCVVLHVDDSDHVDRIEWFDLEDWDDALARLDELGAPAPADPRHPRAENAATRTRGRVLECLNAGRFEEAGALLTDDFERVDRRTVVSMPTSRGRDAFVASSRATADAGFTDITFEPMAIRGDRLELSRVAMRAADGHEMVFLNIGEVDETGRACRTTSFDEDALDDAIAALDTRYLTGEGAPHAPTLDAGLRALAALQSEDWATLRTHLRDDYSFVDHRQLSNPSLDREGYIEVQQLFAEQIRRRMLVRTLHPVARALLTTFDVTGTDAGGGAFEWGFHLVSTFDGDGRITGSELFDDADFDVALARLDELGAGPVESATVRPVNAATRAVDRFFDRARAGDVDDAAAQLAPDVVRIDHRTAVADATTHGRDEYLAALRGAFDVGFAAVGIDHLAVRGERLALFRSTFTTDSEMQLVMLSVAEIDPDGLVSHISLYDDGALDDAVADLEARYIGGEGADARIENAASRWARRLNELMNQGMLDEAAEMYAPDAVALDRRSVVSVPNLHGRAAIRENLEALRDVGLTRVRTKVLAVRGERLVLQRLVFSTADGREMTTLGLNEWDHGEVVCRVVFDEDAVADALVELDRRYAADEGAEPSAPPGIENTATRAVLDAVAHWQSGELDFDDTIAENVVRFDTRRSVATPTLEGRAAFIENVRAIYDVFDSLVLEPLAIRGDRVALFRVTLSRDGIAATMLGVYETDERGLVVRGTSFDDEDLDLALDELEDRFVAGEGAARE